MMRRTHFENMRVNRARQAEIAARRAAADAKACEVNMLAIRNGMRPSCVGASNFQACAIVYSELSEIRAGLDAEREDARKAVA